MRKRRPSHPAIDADELFDPAALAEEAIRSNLDPNVFDKIDDRDIAWPRNWFEWVNGPQFLNVAPFAKQVEICTNLFGQFCPHCSDERLVQVDANFGNRLLLLDTDMSLGDVQDRVVFLRDGRCPKCRVTRPELVAEKQLTHYVNVCGSAGMRSSKTVTVGGLIATYQLVRYLALPNPSRFFNLMANQMLHGTFVAVTATQCYDTLWQAFKDRVDNGPWFAMYHSFLKTEAARLGKEALYDSKDTYVWYGHKQLSFSFCGPDIRTIRGRTRILTSIDEIAWFDVQAEASNPTTKVRLNAQETHEALVKSLRTIRSAAVRLRSDQSLDPPDGINADISSPSSINDAIMRGLRSSVSDPTIYSFHYATWEMNPNIPLDSLRDEMRNPEAFERDYAAVPPLGANQFIGSVSAVNKCASGPSQTQHGTWEEKRFRDQFGDETIYLSVRPLRDKQKPRMLTIDTGLTNNSFALTVWSFDVALKRPVCDMALECMPRQSESERISVNFPLMFEHAIVPLLQNMWICLVVYDRWQSVEAMQRIRKDHRVEAVQYSLRYADFTQVRARVLDSLLVLPKLELQLDNLRRDDRPFDQIIRNYPVTHMAVQLLTVREAGRRVIKPLNGTDDLFRCLCLAVTFMLDAKYTPRFERIGTALGMGRGQIGTLRAKQSIGQSVRGGTVTRVGVRRPYSTRVIK